MPRNEEMKHQKGLEARLGLMKLGREETLWIKQRLLSLLLFVVVFTVSARGQPKDGCRSSCGSLTIPYPFGLEEGCYHDPSFLITCYGSDTPFIVDTNFKVLNISLEGEIRVDMDMVYSCYNSRGNYFKYDGFRNWTGTYFTLSNKRNKFIAVGCDTYAYLEGFRGITFKTGCMSVCYSDQDIDSADGSCSGVSCCQIPIPGGVKYFNMTASSFHNRTEVREVNRCSYAFVVEDGYFNFSGASDVKGMRNVSKFPVVLDWSIGDQNCEQIGNLSVCSENSDCINSSNKPGYLCKCRDGHQGNPYLPNGCQDVDECARGMHNCNKSEFCHNTKGSFECHCPKDYHGDATKGCTSKTPAWKIILLGFGLGLGLLLLALGAWQLYKILRKQKEINCKKKFFKRNGGLLLQQQIAATEDNFKKTRIFNTKELERATDKFNEDRILGHGGQGTVYKGMLVDGRIVAIKKSKAVDEDNLEGFINEVVILSQINHRNIVKLLGCCLETEVPILVYEFIPNGNLFEHLHDEEFDDFTMTWEVRLWIALEVAGALSYLHSAASIPIYHRDIKSTNILLDEKYRAKVSDFGTSRSVTIDHTHLTTLVSGTVGYIDPEYFQSSRFTEKSDVYSFGVVLAELITGGKPVSLLRSQECRSLVTYFIASMKENKLFDIIDVRIKDDLKAEEVIAVANLVKRCLRLNGKKRPTMREVLIELERIRSSLKDSRIQLQSDEEDEATEINIGDSWNEFRTAPAFNVAATSSSDVEPLVPYRTW